MTTEKRKIASRENGKLGGRPATGQTPRLPVTFPVEWLTRLDQHITTPRERSRFIMEIVNRELQKRESPDSPDVLP
ncbi:MAG: hypothetical protein Q4D62_14165 [Planctomycetia bacterium]|nr:hypothetical protein [Planctomycetia bacterium]